MAWLRIQNAAKHADVSPRTVRRWLNEGLRHSRVNGTVFISETALDEFFKSHEVQADEAERIANRVLAEI